MTEIDELRARIEKLEEFVGFRELPTHLDALGAETPPLDGYPMSGYGGLHPFGFTGNVSFSPRRGYSQDIMDYKKAQAYGLGKSHKSDNRGRHETVDPTLQPYYDKGYEEGWS